MADTAPRSRVPDDLATFNEDAAEISYEALSVLVSKQMDYGPANIALAPGGPINGLLVRLFDKLHRLENLTATGATPEHESLEDTFLDVTELLQGVSSPFVGFNLRNGNVLLSSLEYNYGHPAQLTITTPEPPMPIGASALGLATASICLAGAFVLKKGRAKRT